MPDHGCPALNRYGSLSANRRDVTGTRLIPKPDWPDVVDPRRATGLFGST